MIQRLIILALSLSCGPAVFAAELFETNPTTPYPPGCISTTRDGLDTPSSGRLVYAQDVIVLTNAGAGGGTANVQTTVFRRGCTEPGRSVLFIQFELVSPGKEFAVPRLWAEVDGEEYPLRLTSEPNSFTHDETGRDLPLGGYEFIVDGLAEQALRPNTKILSPSQYSGAFTLKFQDVLDESREFSVGIPEWNTSIVPFIFPLHGRLTGTWVAEGAADQGFVISFNEFIDGDSVRQLVFFSWYTFAADGSTLWLTAAATFEVGDGEVELSLERVTNGSFMGADAADREVVGSATLRAISCNEMALDFDLEALDLGTGVATLRRIFSLETSGYACRDLEARSDAL